MTNPIQGASVAAQQIQKASQATSTSSPSVSSSSSSKDFASVLEATQANQADPTARVDVASPAQKVERSSAAQKLDNFVEGVFKDQAKIEKMMRRCVRGKTLSQPELLRLQGLIYGYAQKVELASKIVDKATGGLKQVMNTQV